MTAVLGRRKAWPEAGAKCGRRAPARQGFTLIELMVVLALLAAMLTLAAPNFITFQRNSQLTSSANSFVAALAAARAEAMKRQLRAFVVPSDGSNWQNGWIVFVDANSNATSGSVSFESGTDIEVARYGALPGNVVQVLSVNATGFKDGSIYYAMFNGSGFMTLVGGSFPSGGANALDFYNGTETRRIIANTTGRMRVCKPPPADASCVMAETF